MVKRFTHGRGWNYADLRVGDVPLKEINLQTMESKPMHSFYLIGEILDRDGWIGGF